MSKSVVLCKVLRACSWISSTPRIRVLLWKIGKSYQKARGQIIPIRQRKEKMSFGCTSLSQKTGRREEKSQDESGKGQKCLTYFPFSVVSLTDLRPRYSSISTSSSRKKASEIYVLLLQENGRAQCRERSEMMLKLKSLWSNLTSLYQMHICPKELKV